MSGAANRAAADETTGLSNQRYATTGAAAVLDRGDADGVEFSDQAGRTKTIQKHDPQQQQLQQIVALRRENERLHAIVIASQPVPGLSLAKLQRLQLDSLSGGAGASALAACDARDLKIMELARAVRALTVKESKQRDRAAAAARELEELRGAAAAAATGMASQVESQANANDGTHPTAARSAPAPSTAIAFGAGVVQSKSMKPAPPPDSVAHLRGMLEKAQRERDRAVIELRATRRALLAEVGCEPSALPSVLAAHGLRTPAAVAVTAAAGGKNGVSSTTIASSSGMTDGTRATNARACIEAGIDEEVADADGSLAEGSSNEGSNISATSGPYTSASSNLASTSNGIESGGTASTAKSDAHTSRAAAALLYQPTAYEIPLATVSALQPLQQQPTAAAEGISSTTWRGRAQTITLLRARIRTLERANAALTSTSDRTLERANAALMDGERGAAASGGFQRANRDNYDAYTHDAACDVSDSGESSLVIMDSAAAAASATDCAFERASDYRGVLDSTPDDNADIAHDGDHSDRQSHSDAETDVAAPFAQSITPIALDRASNDRTEAQLQQAQLQQQQQQQQQQQAQLQMQHQGQQRTRHMSVSSSVADRAERDVLRVGESRCVRVCM